MSENIYRKVRNTLGLTQLELADSASVTRQVVLKIENYQYASPPPAVTSALVRACRGAELPVSERDLRAGYLLGAVSVRNANKMKLNVDEAFFKMLGELYDPWKTYRRRVHETQYGFSQLLAFDLASLQAYEREGAYEDQLFDALSTVLIPQRFEKLVEAVRKKKVRA